MVLINKIEDVSKCCCHGDSTYRDVLSFKVDWTDDRISLEVIDICDNCGVSDGESYYIRFALEV